MKGNMILAAICLLLLWLILSVPCNGQERNVQARVYHVVEKSKKQLYYLALSMTGDTIHLRYTRQLRYYGRRIKIGTWVTIHTYYNDKECEWNYRKITINN